MATTVDESRARLRIRRKLQVVESGFTDASRRRLMARKHKDTVTEMLCSAEIDAALEERERLVAELEATS